MSYFRQRFSSFEEFQREGMVGGDTLGKEELELLRELEQSDDFDKPKAQRRRSVWD